MSDVVIVSKAAFEHEWVPEGRVPYGTVFTDEAFEAHQGTTREALHEGAVVSVDWRGASSDAATLVEVPVAKVPAKKK